MWSVSIEYTGERRLSDGARVKTAAVWIRDEKENTIVDTRDYDVWPLAEKHQRVLEAAPDLLNACKEVLMLAGSTAYSARLRQREILETVIAKAEGRV